MTRLALGFAVLFVLASPFAATAQDLHGLISASGGTTTSKTSDAASSEFTSLRESIDLNFNKTFSDLLRYRLILRGENQDSWDKVGGERNDTSSTLVQPGLDVTLAAPFYSLNFGGRIQETASRGTKQQEQMLTDATMFARLFYTPEGLPTVSLIFDKTLSYDDQDPRTRDTDITRLQIGAQYTYRELTAAYNYTREITEDKVGEATRTQDVHSGSLGYAKSYLEGRVTFQGTATANITDTVEDFLVPGTARLERQLARGLQADADPTPTDSADFPVRSEPALVSRTANVPLAVLSVVGFELTVREAVSEIRIGVAPESPFTIPNNLNAFLSFQVLVTDDLALLAWTEVPGVSQAFDTFENRFVLTFPATTAKFFKVYVSRNDFGGLVKATGITALATANVREGAERRTASKNASIAATLTVSPLRWLTIVYDGSLSGSETAPGSIETLSGVNTLSMTAELHRLLKATAMVQYTFTETNQEGATNSSGNNYSLTLSSTPLPTLTTALVLARTETRLDAPLLSFTGGELQIRTDAASLTASAKVLPGLNADATVSVARTEDFTNTTATRERAGRRETFTRGATINLNSRSSSRINSIFTYSYTVADTSLAIAGTPAQLTTHTGSLGTTYTLTRMVNVNTRFDFSNTNTGTSLAQTYRLDLNPTLKTSAFITYRRTDTDAGGIKSSSNTIAVNARWNISRHLDLGADSAFSDTTTGARMQSLQSANVTVAFRF